jgi:hypothetical protein
VKPRVQRDDETTALSGIVNGRLYFFAKFLQKFFRSGASVGEAAI